MKDIEEALETHLKQYLHINKILAFFPNLLLHSKKGSFHIKPYLLKINLSNESLHCNKISISSLSSIKISFVVHKGGNFYIQLIKIKVSNTTKTLLLSLIVHLYQTSVIYLLPLKVSSLVYKKEGFSIKPTNSNTAGSFLATFL